MKRKILTIFMSVLAIFTCAVALVACGDIDDSGVGDGSDGGDDTHTHSYINYVYNDDATCVEDGVLYIDKHLIVAEKTISGAYTVKQGTLTIADRAFSGCGSLEAITIPKSVIGVGDYVFPYCKNLTIYCEAPEKPSGWSAI